MTADIKLLPLYAELQGHPKLEIIKHYARAVAKHNVAARDAEIEALRAERDLFRAETIALAKDAERLAEALRLALKWAEVLPAGEPLRAESVRDLDTARAALRDHDQEGKDGQPD